MDDESSLDFNFWPSFSDMMLSLVLILLLVLFVVSAVVSSGTIDNSRVAERQGRVVEALARHFHVAAETLNKTTLENDKRQGRLDLGLAVSEPGKYAVRVRNEPQLQKISFSDRILFPLGVYELQPSGRSVLRTVGDVLLTQLPSIRGVQIQGHTDTVPIANRQRYRSNIELSALRSIAVTDFLRDSVGIDPTRVLMSAAGFGEFKPVLRSDDDTTYDRTRLSLDNRTQELRDANRRIELLLIYDDNPSASYK